MILRQPAQTPMTARLTFLLSAITLCGIVAPGLHAAPVTVPNFSFEAEGTADNGETVGSTVTGLGVSGWVQGGQAQAFGTADPNNAKFPNATGNDAPLPGTADGGQAVFMNTGAIANAAATLTSAASLAAVQSESVYTLTVAVGNALGTGTQVPGIFRIALLANGVEVSNFITDDANLITDGNFADFSTTFTTAAASPLAGQALTIRLTTDNDGPNANAQIFFDNVRLDAVTSVVPPTAVDVASPDGKVVLSIGPDLTGRLTYQVKYLGQPVVLTSPLGPKVAGQDLGLAATAGAPVTAVINETYPLIGGHATATNHCNEAVFPITGGVAPVAWTLEARVFNDGVGLRYRVPGAGTRTINGEASQWILPAGATIHDQDAGNASYESVFTSGPVSGLATSSQIRSTAVVQLTGPLYVMMTEANLVGYSDMSLRYEGANTFQAYFRNNTSGWSNDGEMLSPWRVTVVAPDLGTLTNTDILTNLCPAPSPALANAAWIKPGRSTWHWMVTGRPVFSAQNSWVDWTRQLGFEYYLIDDGWKDWTSGALDAWGCMKAVVDYGKIQNVDIWAWVHTNEVTIAAQRAVYFQKAKDAGLVGLKIDFMGPPDAGWVKWYDDTLADAAAFGLMVDFHGCVKPSGRNRTWPHELTREAVNGRENGKRPGYHDAVIPFTRFVQGHGDYTPTDFRGNKLGANSYAHELAQAVVYTSPFFCYSGDPQNYLQNAAIDVLRTIPATWDETRVLPGSVLGQVAGYARRKGSIWFIGVVNASTAGSFNIDLGFIGAGNFVIDKLGDSAASNAAWVGTRENVTSSHTFSTALRADGGFVGRIVPASLLPAAPTGLNAMGASGRVELVWSALPGVTSYSLQRATTAGGPYITAANNLTTTAFTDTSIAGATTYFYTVSSINNYGSSAPSAEAPATPTSGLPAGWISGDVGNTGKAGFAARYNDVFTVNGAGADIFAGNDSFHFLRRNWTGDGVLVARVLALDGSDAWAKVGVMFRETTATNSRYAFSFLTPGNGTAFQLRTTASLNTNIAGRTAPYWVELVRRGDSFTSFTSPDGTTWTQLGAPTDNPMASGLSAGLAVCSHATGTLNTARFDHVGFLSTPSALAKTDLSESQLRLAPRPARTPGPSLPVRCHRAPSYTTTAVYPPPPSTITGSRQTAPTPTPATPPSRRQLPPVWATAFPAGGVTNISATGFPPPETPPDPQILTVTAKTTATNTSPAPIPTIRKVH